jgi:8-oxo-dGTP pyrophosphatase MutT (NUDIX family)
MILNNDTFAEEDIVSLTGGAGIIPIAVDECGNYFTLLGRERFITGWRGSCRWSGFEGTRHPGEPILETAVRECSEESGGILGARAELRDRLLNGEYWRRLVLRVQTADKDDRYHLTYVLPMPLDDTLIPRFNQVRSSLSCALMLSHKWSYTRPKSCAPRVIVVEANPDDSFLTLLSESSDVTGMEAWGPCAHDPTVAFHTVTCPFEMRRVRAWNDTRTNLEKCLATIETHEACHITRDARWGSLTNVTINEDFLEKDIIKWWGLNDLKQVLIQGGEFGQNKFRPFFIPVLQMLVTELSNAHALAQSCHESKAAPL